jgi:G:T-mismatch repair DNA endonuclease (very short patch repair protein)
LAFFTFPKENNRVKITYANPDLNLGLTFCKCRPDILLDKQFVSVYKHGCRWLSPIKLIKGDIADFAF